MTGPALRARPQARIPPTRHAREARSFTGEQTSTAGPASSSKTEFSFAPRQTRLSCGAPNRSPRGQGDRMRESKEGVRDAGQESEVESSSSPRRPRSPHARARSSRCSVRSRRRTASNGTMAEQASSPRQPGARESRARGRSGVEERSRPKNRYQDACRRAATELDCSIPSTRRSMPPDTGLRRRGTMLQQRRQVPVSCNQRIRERAHPLDVHAGGLGLFQAPA